QPWPFFSERLSYILFLPLWNDGSCRYKPENSVANDTGVIYIPKHEEALKKAVASVGPISVSIDASLRSFQFYKKGIYYDPDCKSSELNHGVLLVGYGFEGTNPNKNKYWLVKNSWSKGWGMDGYIKIARDQNNVCGIATAACYPTVN
uniref:Peptidase C1A papain C-terminal domain-containing protein n=1 Tax=Spermophilus dauricus TaxID=99837 RepID=A0A8C9UR16_SPEDA